MYVDVYGNFWGSTLIKGFAWFAFLSWCHHTTKSEGFAPIDMNMANGH